MRPVCAGAPVQYEQTVGRRLPGLTTWVCRCTTSAPAGPCRTRSRQGLTLVHFSAQRKHILLDTLGACFSPSLLDSGTRGGVTTFRPIRRVHDRPPVYLTGEREEV